MNWRIDSAAPVSAKDLRMHLEKVAALLVRQTCPPVEDTSAGLLAPKYGESKESMAMREEMATAIDMACALANSIEATRVDSLYLASLSDVLTVEGCRRINVSLEEAPPPAAPPETVDVTKGGNNFMSSMAEIAGLTPR